MCKAWKVCPSPRYDQMGAMMVVLGGGDPNDADTWQEAYDRMMGHGSTKEQQALEMKNLPQATREHVMLLPQRLMNSYAEVAARQQLYAEGDWIVHFAGSPHKDQLVVEFAR